MELFRGGWLSGAGPDEFTLTTVPTAFANVALDQARWTSMYIK